MMNRAGDVEMRKLTKAQREVLIWISDECLTDDCTGGCNHGWYEPLERGFLRTACALERRGLVSLANGSHARWTAGHVTKLGRRAREALRPCDFCEKRIRLPGFPWCWACTKRDSRGRKEAQSAA